MAEEDSNRPGNGSAAEANDAQAATLAQYIKDLSVESPSAPAVFQWQEQPTLDVNFNLGVERVGDDVNEVVLKIEVRAQSEKGVHFLVDLSFGGLFGMRNFPEEAIGPFLLVEAPRLLFPFARQIVAESVQHMGFAPLLLEPIDFAAAYMAQVQAIQQQQQQQQGEGAASGGTEPAQSADKGSSEG